MLMVVHVNQALFARLLGYVDLSLEVLHTVCMCVCVRALWKEFSLLTTEILRALSRY